MKNPFAQISNLLLNSNLPFDIRGEEVQIYTPREFVTGYIELPKHAKPLEAAWHAAAVALETENIRIIHHIADKGIYFIAAAAADFASHPNAMSPLAAVLPASSGYKGDGAYFVEMGGGIVAVVIKGDKTLQSYIGEREDCLRFAAGKQHVWPDKCELWVGYTQFESRHARRLSSISILAGMVLTGVFLIIALTASIATKSVKYRASAVLDGIRTEQKEVAAQLADMPSTDAYSAYRKIAMQIIALGGKLTHVELTSNSIRYKANFPLWVTDLKDLGDIHTHVDGDHIVAATK